MLVLVAILVLFGVILLIITYLNRKNKPDEIEIIENNDGECCGAHEVCDKDSLLSSQDKIEYFDDEELDKLAGIEPKDFSNEQITQLSEVFYTLKENEIAAWLRSLQLRCIDLPIDIREQALLIVAERRGI